MDFDEVIRKRNLNEIKKLLSHYESYPNELICLAAETTLEIMELCVKHGANINGKTVHGYNPLFAAVRTENAEEKVSYLLKKGLDINTKYGLAKITPIHTAVLYNKYELLGYLKSVGTDLDSQAHAGMTPIMRAAFTKKYQSFEKLLQLGADPNLRDHKGNNVTDYAKEDKELIRISLHYLHLFDEQQQKVLKNLRLQTLFY